VVEGREPDAKHGLADEVFASLKFFYFLVRRYSGVSYAQVWRKFAAGSKLLSGLIHVASEYRLGGEALFAGREAKFVKAVCRSCVGTKYLSTDYEIVQECRDGRLARSGTVRRALGRRWLRWIELRNSECTMAGSNVADFEIDFSNDFWPRAVLLARVRVAKNA
jgi:hypothetical protein